MQFFFLRREKYKEEREKERKVLSNWRAENRRKKKRRKDFHVPFQQRACVCVPSSCWITRDGKERKIHLLRTNLPISFPFLKRSGGEIKPTERLLLSTGPRAFFFHQEISFHFSSCSYFFFYIYLRISPKDLRVRSIVPWYYDQILPSVPSDTLIGEIFQ